MISLPLYIDSDVITPISPSQHSHIDIPILMSSPYRPSSYLNIPFPISYPCLHPNILIPTSPSRYLHPYIPTPTSSPPYPHISTSVSPPQLLHPVISTPTSTPRYSHPVSHPNTPHILTLCSPLQVCSRLRGGPQRAGPDMRAAGLVAPPRCPRAPAAHGGATGQPGDAALPGQRGPPLLLPLVTGGRAAPAQQRPEPAAR